jgi:hypothetical protein
MQEVEKEEKKITAVTDETSRAVTNETGQAVTKTLDQVNASNKEITTSMAVTMNENDNQVTLSTNEGEINSERNMTGSILAGRLEEGIRDNQETEQTNKEEEI